MSDPFGTDPDAPRPGDAQAGVRCNFCDADMSPGSRGHAPNCPVASYYVPAPVAGPVIDAVLRNAARRFVTDTLSPRRFVGVEDVAFADLHRLAAAVGPWAAGRLRAWLGLPLPADWAEWLVLRLESRVDKEAWAEAASQESLRLFGPFIEAQAAAMPTAAPSSSPHLLGEAARCPVPRSPHWPAVRDKWLREHPTCTACDATDGVEVHHAVAVHMDRSRELDPTNFVSLCRPRGCHFRCGHGYDWQAIVPTVRVDAAHQLALAQGRLYDLPDAPAT